VAAKIASTGRPLQVAAVTGNGMLSLLSCDSSLKSIEDLRGKTVAVAGQGAVPEYVFRKILLAHGLKSEDLKLNFSLGYPEIAQSLIAGRVSIALLPEPFATIARQGRKNLQDIADVQQEWVASGGIANYPMTVLVLNADFAKNNRQAVDAILKAYENSIKMVTSQYAEAGRLVEKHDLGLRSAVVQAAIPKSAYTFIPAARARPALEALFKTLLDFDPASIGAVMPADNFYYE
jgi:NitT/TauT family transport system substrate-binding protein